MEEVGDEMVGKDVSVLHARREAMAGAAEGDCEKMNIAVWWKR